jgi:hypothetical protein
MSLTCVTHFDLVGYGSLVFGHFVFGAHQMHLELRIRIAENIASLAKPAVVLDPILFLFTQVRRVFVRHAVLVVAYGRSIQ